MNHYSKTTLLLGAGAATWFGVIYFMLFRTAYTYTYYQLPNCGRTLTVMEINGGLGPRQVAFIVGDYHERGLPPTHDFIVSGLGSGMEAYSACLPTCEDGIITINYIDGSLHPEGQPDGHRFSADYGSASIKYSFLAGEEYSFALQKQGKEYEVVIE